jgi:DNA polymerase (family 10)
VEIAVNPDAHSIEGIGDIRWGVAAARKGGLSKSMCWNAREADEFSRWLDDRRMARHPATAG